MIEFDEMVEPQGKVKANILKALNCHWGFVDLDLNGQNLDSLLCCVVRLILATWEINCVSCMKLLKLLFFSMALFKMGKWSLNMPYFEEILLTKELYADKVRLGFWIRNEYRSIADKFYLFNQLITNPDQTDVVPAVD